MKNEIYHNVFIYNSQLMGKNAIDKISYNDGIVVYEVIRIVGGIPLFMEDHLMRLHYSASLAGFQPWISDLEITNSIKQLCVENQVLSGNVKFLFQFKPDHTALFLCFFIKHNYPILSQYKSGVKLMLHQAERPTPNAKLFNTELHETTGEIISKSEIYELLLVNKNGLITEGSKSNVFFIKGNLLFTAPKRMVLPGITRKFVLKIALLSGIDVIEECVHQNDLDQYDAAFISGTSPKILPIASIGDIQYNPHHPLIKKLIKDYEEEIENYIYRFS